MTPGSQFPHSNAYQAAIAGNDAANLAQRSQTGNWDMTSDPGTEARQEEAQFLEVFGEDPFQYTLNERYARWQAYRAEHGEA